MSAKWRDAYAAGMAPPALLRARAIEAEEVLVLTYTADLRFFERVALAEARASQARVTIAHDIAADLTNPADVKHAGTHYTDVPVRCRSGGEFHPKLLVIAGRDQAVVAIGSGNATASGWHHNGELWTTMLADETDWPQTFHDLADWLEQLPDALYIDSLGAARLKSVATLLKRPRAKIPGPTLAHNLNRALLGQLPRPTGHTERATVASPFLDLECSALREVTARLKPQVITLALTPNASADAAAITAWAQEFPGARVAPISTTRYHHGKLVQWHAPNRDATALVGSANVTAAAMLRTTTQRWGNCELGLICANVPDLTPPLADALDLGDTSQLDDLLVPASSRERTDDSDPRLLRAIRENDHTVVVLVCADDDTDGAELITVESRSPLQLDASDRHQHTFRVRHSFEPGALCHVELADGRRSGQVRITDVDAVLARPGTGSPLDHNSVADVARSQALTRKLLDALLELAGARPEQEGGTSTRRSTRGVWRRHGERTSGSALIALALGRQHLTGGGDDDAGHETEDDPIGERDLGDVVSETTDDDEGEPPLFDDGQDTDAGVKDIFDATADPVSALAADPISARRLATAIEHRTANLDEWNPVALLALLRLSFIVAAGSGWSPNDAAWTITAILNALIGTADDSLDDADLAEAWDAAFLVGLAVIREAIEDWDQGPESLPGWFEHLRAEASIDPSAINRDRVDHYAADLHLAYGSTLRGEALMDAADFLAASSALARALEDLESTYPNISLSHDRCVSVQVPKAGLPVALRILDALDDHAPLAVRVTGSDGITHAAWQPKHLTVQRFTSVGAPVGGSQHTLVVGPGAYRDGRLPQPIARWFADMPPTTVLAAMQRDGVAPDAGVVVVDDAAG